VHHIRSPAELIVWRHGFPGTQQTMAIFIDETRERLR
jgi:hypothetical protein